MTKKPLTSLGAMIYSATGQPADLGLNQDLRKVSVASTCNHTRIQRKKLGVKRRDKNRCDLGTSFNRCNHNSIREHFTKSL